MKTIKSKREFDEVFSSGKRVNHRLVRATVLKDDEGGLGKVAFVAPKRLGKRVLREAARANGLPLDGAKVILFATRNTRDASVEDLTNAVKQIKSRAGL